jgi:hypothetical protein
MLVTHGKSLELQKMKTGLITQGSLMIKAENCYNCQGAQWTGEGEDLQMDFLTFK